MRSALAVALLALPAVAEAHIFLMEPVSRATDATGNPQKDPPCGGIGSVRNPAKVTTFMPGQTITLKFKETVTHSGWTRVSFQQNGQMFPIPPAGNGPPASYPDMVAANTVDTATGSMVLMDRIPDTAINVETTVQITLPDVECNNCTLQFMQIMTDGGAGTYNGDPDLYFNCADITLSRTPPPPDAGVTAMPDADLGGGGGGGGGGNNNGQMVSGGCSTSGGSSSAVLAFALVGFAGLRRRSRR